MNPNLSPTQKRSTPRVGLKFQICLALGAKARRGPPGRQLGATPRARAVATVDVTELALEVDFLAGHYAVADNEREGSQHHQRPEILERDRQADKRTMQDYLGHRDPRHAVHYTRVSGRRFEGLSK
jgi:hypothetical protein